jgi:shikimate 5-dehydrogenase
MNGKVVMLVGLGGMTHVLARGVQQAGGIPVVAGRDRARAHDLAKALGCRFVLPEAVYSTAHEVLVVTDDTELHPGYLKPGMTVMDLSEPLRPSPLLREASERGCAVVSPERVLAELAARQVRAIAGEDIPREPLLAVIRGLVED